MGDAIQISVNDWSHFSAKISEVSKHRRRPILPWRQRRWVIILRVTILARYIILTLRCNMHVQKTGIVPVSQQSWCNTYCMQLFVCDCCFLYKHNWFKISDAGSASLTVTCFASLSTFCFISYIIAWLRCVSSIAKQTADTGRLLHDDNYGSDHNCSLRERGEGSNITPNLVTVTMVHMMQCAKTLTQLIAVCCRECYVVIRKQTALHLLSSSSALHSFTLSWV